MVSNIECAWTSSVLWNLVPRLSLRGRTRVQHKFGGIQTTLKIVTGCGIWNILKVRWEILGRRNLNIRDSTHSHFCIGIVSSWDGCNTQEKWKTKVVQNFWGQTWCIMGDVQMVNRVSGHSLWPKILRVICSVLNIIKCPVLFAESFLTPARLFAVK